MRLLENATPSPNGPAQLGSPNPHVPEVVLYPLPNFLGDPARVNLSYPRLAPSADNRIRSVIVVSGQWEFFLDPNYQRKIGSTAGPGYYAALGPADGTISSFRFVG